MVGFSNKSTVDDNGIYKDSISVEAGDGFTLTPHMKSICERASTYLQVGYAVHLVGPAGTGKTTLALHVAS